MERSRRTKGGSCCSGLSPRAAGSSAAEGSREPSLDSARAVLALRFARTRGTGSGCSLIAIYFPRVWGEKVLCHKTLL